MRGPGLFNVGDNATLHNRQTIDGVTFGDHGTLIDTRAANVGGTVTTRLTAQDPTLWGPDAESEASIRLSWVSLHESSRQLVGTLAGHTARQPPNTAALCA